MLIGSLVNSGGQPTGKPAIVEPEINAHCRPCIFKCPVQLKTAQPRSGGKWHSKMRSLESLSGGSHPSCRRLACTSGLAQSAPFPGCKIRDPADRVPELTRTDDIKL